MARRTGTRTTRTTHATRVIDTPWGRTVTCVAPGAQDDPTIALFELPAPAPSTPDRHTLDGSALDSLIAGDGLFGEFVTRTATPASSLRNIAPLPVAALDACLGDADLAAAVVEAEELLAPAELTVPEQAEAPEPVAVPTAEIVAVVIEQDVPVSFFDTAPELREHLAAGDLVDGEVYVIDGHVTSDGGLLRAGVVVQGAAVDLGSLPDGHSWETFHGGRYSTSFEVAVAVREGM